MRTATSPGQWQPWTAVSALLGIAIRAEIRLQTLCSLPFSAEAGAKHSFKVLARPGVIVFECVTCFIVFFFKLCLCIDIVEVY